MSELVPDAILMQDLANGNRDALAELFQRHHQTVYAMCCRMCSSEAAAEDVTQEVFLRVLRRAETFSGRAQFTTWLYRITRNACLDHLRKWKREQAKRERLAADHTLTETNPVIGLEELVRLREAMNRLQPETREVLVLRRYHELAYDEIAEVCGCSVGAVRVRMHRALQALRKTYLMLGDQAANQRVAEGET